MAQRGEGTNYVGPTNATGPGSGTKGSALSAAKFTVSPMGKSGTDVIEGTVTGLASRRNYASPLLSLSLSLFLSPPSLSFSLSALASR